MAKKPLSKIAASHALLSEPISPGKTRPGREKHATTRQNKLFVMCARICGWSQVDIARMLDVDPSTITRKYRHELDLARKEIGTEAVAALMKLVRKGHFPSIKLVLERQFGWIEKKVSLRGADDPKQMTDEQLAQRLVELKQTREERAQRVEIDKADKDTDETLH